MRHSQIARKLFVLLLTLAVTGGAFATGQTEAEDQPEMTFILAEWAERGLTDFVDVWAEERGISVNMELYPFDVFMETIEVRSRSEATDVDVNLVDGPLTANYAARGIIQALDPYISRAEMEEAWAPGTIAAGSYDGGFYSAPMQSSSQLLFYNKDLLRQAGIDFPSAEVTERWTWDELVDAAVKVDALGDEIAGFQFEQITRYYQLQPLPESLGGGDGMGSDGFVDVTNPEWITAFEWYQSLYNELGIARQGSTQALEVFTAGRTGFLVGGTTNLTGGRLEVEGLDYGIAPHPYFADGVPVTPNGSWHIGIWSNSQYPDEAADFIRWMTLDQANAREWFDVFGAFPAHLGVLEQLQTDETYAEFPLFGFRIAAYEAANTARPRAPTPGYFEFERTLNETFEDIRNGVDVETALSSAETRINAALERYR